jgi:hypothetical protein
MSPEASQGSWTELRTTYQPQDGGSTAAKRVTDIANRLGKAMLGEPEDARLTGGTRSLMRRLSGLNTRLATKQTGSGRFPAPISNIA